MASEAWSVVSRYTFISNARTVLGETTGLVNDLTLALDRLTVAYKEQQASARGVLTSQSSIRRSLGLTAESAEKSATGVDNAFDRIALSARRAAGAVTGSAAAIRRDMRAMEASGAGIGTGGIAGGAVAARGGAGWGAKLGVGAGIASAVALASGIGVGSGIQQSAAQTGVAMGRSTADTMRDLAPIAMRMSDITAQSQAQSMSLINVLATSGLNTPDLLMDRNAELPMAIARYADTQFLGPHHVAFDDSARTAAQIAHQFGARTGHELTPILDTLFKMSNDMPDTISKAATQLKYYAPQFINAGVSGSEILQLQATADRMGLGGGRSGTGFRQVYQSLISPTLPQWEAQNALGMIDAGGHSKFIGRDGRLNIEAFFQDITRQFEDVKKNHGDVRGFQENLAHVTTATGASVLNIFGTDKGQAQREAVRQTLARIPHLEVAQAQLMETVNGQFRRLITNLQNLTGVLAGPLIQPLTDFLKNSADLVGNLATWFSHHPTATAIGTTAMVGGGIFGIVAALKGLAGFHATIREFAHVGRIGIGAGEHLGATGAGGVVGAVAAREAGPISRIGGAIGKGILSVLRFDTLRGAVSRIPSAFKPMGPLAGDISGAFRGIGRLFIDLVPGVRQLGGAFNNVRFFIGPLADLLGHFAGRALLLGLRIVPVVGEVLLLIDAIKFLGAHAKDIGAGLGVAAHWIVAHGAPMLRDAFVEVVKFIVNGIKDTIGGLFNGGHGGVFDWMRTVITSATQSYQQADLKDRQAQMGPPADLQTIRKPPKGAGKAKQVSMLPGSDAYHFYGDINVTTKTDEQARTVMSRIKGNARSSMNNGGTTSRSTPKMPRILGNPVGAA